MSTLISTVSEEQTHVEDGDDDDEGVGSRKLSSSSKARGLGGLAGELPSRPLDGVAFDGSAAEFLGVSKRVGELL